MHLCAVHSLDDALDALRKSNFDTALLVCGDSADTSLARLRAIRKSFRDLPLIAISLSPTRPNVLALLRNGATGFVGDNALTTELDNAIRNVLRGHRYVS